MATFSTNDATTTAEERAEAAAMRSNVVDGAAAARAAAAAAEAGGGDAAEFPAAKIDAGVFKYVLIEASDPASGSVVHLVRGDLRAAYHKDAARATTEALAAAGWPYKVLGGGRINHDEDAKSILVYGFSYGFPWQVFC